VEKFSIYKLEILARLANNRFLSLTFYTKKKPTHKPFPLPSPNYIHTTTNMSNLGALDMALDDVISQNRTNKRSSNNNSGGRRGGSSRGGISKSRSSGGRPSVC